MPPLSLHTNIPSPSNQLATNKEEAKDQSDVVIEVKYEDVGDILESCLCEAEISGGLDEKKASDVRKRIGIFKEKWTSDKLNNKLHQGSIRILRKHLYSTNFNFSSKQKKFFFNITFWQNFHAAVGLVHK